MRKEIEQYEQEIAERRQALLDMKRDFAILQFSMTPADKSQRKAEVPSAISFLILSSPLTTL